MLHIRSKIGKGAIAAAVSAAVVLTGAGIAVASASGTAITTATTIRLEARGGTSTFVNVRHLSHPAVGDEVILAQPVFSAAHPSQLAGHGFVTVILVGNNSEQDHATLVLKQGEVDAAGVQASSTFQLAVTGGTGRFQNARGQADVKLLPGPGNKALITLHLLP
jgi:putative NADH-flavin reductase